MSLYVKFGSLRFHSNFKDVEYVIMLRNEIEEFRFLFIEWVAFFCASNYIQGDWELFNPPEAIRIDSCDFYDDFFDDSNFLDYDDNENQLMKCCQYGVQIGITF